MDDPWHSVIKIYQVLSRATWASINRWVLVLMICNKGAYLTFNSIYFNLVWLWNHAWIHSWNQPVLSNEFKISSSRKQREPLMGSNWWLSEYKSCYPLHHTASCVSHTRLNKIFLLKSAKLGKQLFFCLRMKILFY